MTLNQILSISSFNEKTLQKHLTFFLPFILLFIVIPVNDRLRFQALENDCFDHGRWIYDRTYLNKKGVDIAFFGSSQTINAINDELIEGRIENKLVANFGYCRLGRNLHFALIKRLLEVKQIEEIFLEVREDEDRYSHDVFPFVASTQDVITPHAFFNRDIAVDIIDHFKYKIELTKDWLFNDNFDILIDTNAFGNYTPADTVAVEVLIQVQKDRLEHIRSLSQFQRDFYMAYPKSYLLDIYNLCEEKGTKLSFIYLPPYGFHQRAPKELAYYSQFGKVYIPPQEIFNNTNNWFDENHLNISGANQLSLWLVEQLKNRE